MLVREVGNSASADFKDYRITAFEAVERSTFISFVVCEDNLAVCFPASEEYRNAPSFYHERIGF